MHLTVHSFTCELQRWYTVLPTSLQAHFNMGNLYRQCAEFSRAIQRCAQACLPTRYLSAACYLPAHLPACLTGFSLAPSPSPGLHPSVMASLGPLHPVAAPPKGALQHAHQPAQGLTPH